MNVITVLVIISVVLAFSSQWLIYKNSLKYVYILMIIQGSVGVLLNCTLAYVCSAQWSLYLFILTCLWQVAMGFKSLNKLAENSRT